MESSIWLKILSLFGALCCVSGANLRCYEGSVDTFSEISLDTPEILLNSSCYQAERETVIYAFGFQENATDYTVQNIIGKHLELNYNTLLLNWEKEANVPILGVASYGIVILNVRTVGKKLGEAIVKLYDAGFYLPSLRLLGFSLGAHVMGYAGKDVNNNGLQISNIIGFDPAGPLFEGVVPLGLDATCAKFVLAIHGNPGLLGTVNNVGTVDIWPNCGSSIQPGCQQNYSEARTPAGCSHNRAWIYYLESLSRTESFPARAASSCDSWNAGKGTDQIIYLGNNIDSGTEGKFYLRTDCEAPFGLGDAGTRPVKTTDDLELNIGDDMTLDDFRK